MRYCWLVWLIVGFHSLPAQDTFSIVAVDSITGEVGSAGASCIDLFRFPFITADQIGEVYPGRGAINTQSYYLEANQRNAATRLIAGDTPEAVIRWLAANDVEGRPQDRQYGIAALSDKCPATAAYTGRDAFDYKGQILGPDYAIQGNILLDRSVLEDMEARFLSAEGDLACRLMAAMQGAKRVGADSRCAVYGTSSLFAYLKVARPDDVFGAPSLRLSVQLRSSDRREPIDALQASFDLARSCETTAVMPTGVTSDGVSVYPNPVRGSLNVKTDNGIPVTVDLVDLAGRVVVRKKASVSHELDVTDLPRGAYIIRIADGYSIVRRRIIVQ